MKSQESEGKTALIEIGKFWELKKFLRCPDDGSALDTSIKTVHLTATLHMKCLQCAKVFSWEGSQRSSVENRREQSPFRVANQFFFSCAQAFLGADQYEAMNRGLCLASLPRGHYEFYRTRCLRAGEGLFEDQLKKVMEFSQQKDDRCRIGFFLFLFLF